MQSQADREKIILAVGNIDHVAQVDDQLTVASPEPESKFYTVKSGDNLSKISKEFYGDANQYNKIFEANRPLLKDADDIFPGQVPLLYEKSFPYITFVYAKIQKNLE